MGIEQTHLFKCNHERNTVLRKPLSIFLAFWKYLLYKKGSGSPVLFIHDLKSTGSAAEWNSVLNDLAKSHTVYAIDLLGCGRSEKLKMTYTNYIYVQLINDFVKDVIRAKTDLVTSGSSSNIAIMSCYSEPELYSHLMLINPPSMKVMAKYPKANHKTLKYLMEIPLIGTTIYNLIHSKGSFAIPVRNLSCIQIAV